MRTRRCITTPRPQALKSKHQQIWFLVDGVCSMFGDLAPIAELRELLERHDNLHLYVDDAHGMSWTGVNGRGYALSSAPLHPKMVLTTSLNKAASDRTMRRCWTTTYTAACKWHHSFSQPLGRKSRSFDIMTSNTWRNASRH